MLATAALLTTIHVTDIAIAQSGWQIESVAAGVTVVARGDWTEEGIDTFTGILAGTANPYTENMKNCREQASSACGERLCWIYFQQNGNGSPNSAVCLFACQDGRGNCPQYPTPPAPSGPQRHD